MVSFVSFSRLIPVLTNPVITAVWLHELLHRVIAGIHAGAEGPLERVESFSVREFCALFLLLLLSGNLCGCLFLRLSR